MESTLDHQSVFDYIIAGGGTAGCVLASRLSQALPDCSIVLVEAGPDAHDEPLVQSPLGGPRLHNTEFEWNYRSVPQRGLGGRQIYQTGGRLLSGSSAVNYGLWTRGHAQDFDSLSQTVGDGKWSYEHLLPCFKRSETHFGLDQSDIKHGFEGPIHTMPAIKQPMHDIIRKAFSQAGIAFNADANIGNPLGASLATSNWHENARQPAGKAYDLSKATVLTNSPIDKILFQTSHQEPRATGVQLYNGTRLDARREVIVCCGALRTPQLLMLSGLGHAPDLESHGIATVAKNSQIGQNLHDPTMVMWNLKHPEKGFAMGSEKFPASPFGPLEWVYTDTVSAEKLATSLNADRHAHPEDFHRVDGPSAHFEMTVSYGPVGAGFIPGLSPPLNGSIMTTGCGVLTPTSRGSVSLLSPNSNDAPRIDPNYLGTDHDLCVLRAAVRQAMRIMSMPAASEEVQGMYTMPNAPAIRPESTDEELDEYLRKLCITWFHPGGTAAMGTVVDSSCRVKGVEGVRIVDASILPEPLSAHYQSPIYAIAERAAEIIVGNL